MDPLNIQPPDDGQPLDPGGLILSSPAGTAAVRQAPEVELATMRHMMETLFARVESLHQNQAVQFAGVHDRLDAVELELPLVQEQTALRIRDLETRMSVEIEEAARLAVEEAASGFQQEVAGKFGSLLAQIETQHKELSLMRESKKATESKLNRAVLDIERLCGNLAPRPPEENHRPLPDAPPSAFRTRIAEHIRKAAVDAAPDDSNPLLSNPDSRKPVAESTPLEAPAAAPRLEPLREPVPQPVAKAVPAVPPQPSPRPVPTPGFEDWKRQFMQEGEPLNPTMNPESGKKVKLIVCPRCFSERTRPATPSRIDALFRLTGLSPHRCKSCAHRFYKRGVPHAEPPLDDEVAESRAEETVGTR